MAECRSRTGQIIATRLCFLCFKVKFILMMLSDLKKIVLLYFSSSEFNWIYKRLFWEDVEMVLVLERLHLEGNLCIFKA